jgi:hypothetical protein
MADHQSVQVDYHIGHSSFFSQAEQKHSSNKPTLGGQGRLVQPGHQVITERQPEVSIGTKSRRNLCLVSHSGGTA